MGAGGDLRSIAWQIVSDRGPIPAERVINELVRHGTSHGYAYKAVVELIRDGRVKRTFFGELYIPGRKHPGSGYGAGPKVVVIIGLTFIIGVMATILYTAWSRGMLF
jgi:hypothetical protein